MHHQIDTLNSTGTPMAEFSSRLWHDLIDHATITPNGAFAFTFKWESNSSASAQ